MNLGFSEKATLSIYNTVAQFPSLNIAEFIVIGLDGSC